MASGHYLRDMVIAKVSRNTPPYPRPRFHTAAYSTSNAMCWHKKRGTIHSLVVRKRREQPRIDTNIRHCIISAV